jgi:hypothetical protein
MGRLRTVVLRNRDQFLAVGRRRPGEIAVLRLDGEAAELEQLMQFPAIGPAEGHLARVFSKHRAIIGSNFDIPPEIAANLVRIDELDRLGNPTLTFQASGIEGIKVRIVAKCDDDAAARRILDAEEGLIRRLLGGDVVFGIDDQSMEAVVLGLLRRKGLTLAVAEGSTYLSRAPHDTKTVSLATHRPLAPPHGLGVPPGHTGAAASSGQPIGASEAARAASTGAAGFHLAAT